MEARRILEENRELIAPNLYDFEDVFYRASRRLLTQFSGNSANEYIACLLTPAQDYQRFLIDLSNSLNLETASGIWLDLLGSRIGIKRPKYKICIDSIGGKNVGFSAKDAQIDTDTVFYSVNGVDCASMTLKQVVLTQSQAKILTAYDIQDIAHVDFLTPCSSTQVAAFVDSEWYPGGPAISTDIGIHEFFIDVIEADKTTPYPTGATFRYEKVKAIKKGKYVLGVTPIYYEVVENTNTGCKAWGYFLVSDEIFRKYIKNRILAGQLTGSYCDLMRYCFEIFGDNLIGIDEFLDPQIGHLNVKINREFEEYERELVEKYAPNAGGISIVLSNINAKTNFGFLGNINNEPLDHTGGNGFIK